MSGFLSAGIVGGPDIPDRVVSRPADDRNFTNSDSRGLVVNPNSDFDKFAAEVSANTSGVSRARLYDYSQSQYIATIDISGLSNGGSFVFDQPVISGVDYGVELDAEGANWTIGFADGATDYPYTGEDFDIIAASNDGVQSLTGETLAVNNIGSSGL